MKLPGVFTPTLNGIKVAARTGKAFSPEEKIAMFAEVEAENMAENPTPDVEEARFSRAESEDRTLIHVEEGDELKLDDLGRVFGGLIAGDAVGAATRFPIPRSLQTYRV
ncbi:hypothetical protein E4U19_008203 [Claviceps sp. Clav32 group G5]|nr:hypothetical protein E4U19_008203 [Claviceps sp. Clav32 group G5]